MKLRQALKPVSTLAGDVGRGVGYGLAAGKVLAVIVAIPLALLALL